MKENIIKIATPVVIIVIWLIKWSRLPQTIGLHYNVRGELDRVGSKNELLLIPIIVAVGMELVLVLCLKYLEKKKGAEANKKEVLAYNKQIKFLFWFGHIFLLVIGFIIIAIIKE